MRNLNQVIFGGYVARDATLSTYPTGLQVANFTVMVNVDTKNGDGEWVGHPVPVRLSLFNKMASSYYAHLRKGTFVEVVGHLDINSYEKDGKKISSLCVKAEKIHLSVSSKKKEGEETCNGTNNCETVGGNESKEGEGKDASAVDGEMMELDDFADYPDIFAPVPDEDYTEF